MPDLDTTLSFQYNIFRGLNLRDDELFLPLGQTPNARNWEINKRTGLKKRQGFERIFDEFDFSVSLSRSSNYFDSTDKHYYVSVNYPNLILINPENGFRTEIDNTMYSYGTPYYIPCPNGKMVVVDGANNPREISDTSVSVAAWPPAYTNSNATLLDESSNTGEPNPTTLGADIGFPSFGAFYENRVWLAGDKLAPQRLYVSKMFAYDDYSNNNTSDYDIAFFLDLPSSSPITGLKVINDKFVAIYCKREIFVLSGKFPPGTNFPEPYFRIDSLNSSVGCLSPWLITSKGDNDHFFLADNGAVYTLNNSDNFQDLKPRGLSSSIFTRFQEIDNETLSRGTLVNHNIKGELHLWYPTEVNRFYPNRRLVLNYSDSDDTEEWSQDGDFENLEFTDSFVDAESKELIVVTPRKFLTGDKGLTYDGQAIELVYQLSTLDFGYPDNRKEIVQIDLYATNNSDTVQKLEFYHLWENGQSGLVIFEIPPSIESRYDESNFNEAVFASFAGKGFSKISRQIPNKIGKILKSKLRHSGEADLFVHSLIFRGRIIGK